MNKELKRFVNGLNDEKFRNYLEDLRWILNWKKDFDGENALMQMICKTHMRAR